MRRRDRPPYELWIMEVNKRVLRRHGMSIFELEDDISRELLRARFEAGISPDEVVDRDVAVVFQDDEDCL